jgi:hypothetical protein
MNRLIYGFLIACLPCYGQTTTICPTFKFAMYTGGREVPELRDTMKELGAPREQAIRSVFVKLGYRITCPSAQIQFSISSAISTTTFKSEDMADTILVSGSSATAKYQQQLKFTAEESNTDGRVMNALEMTTALVMSKIDPGFAQRVESYFERHPELVKAKP